MSALRKMQLVAVVTLLLVLFAPFTSVSRAADEVEIFPQTGKKLTGKFLTYWRANGGLATYGFPITDAKPEIDPETGKTFLTQWFERNRFELHPENANTKYEILLGLLGKDLRREAPGVDRAFQKEPAPAAAPNLLYFEPTGFTVRGTFLSYWLAKGGLERFGYPISTARNELDPETGQVFQMQWFERARLEFHPGNPPEYLVLLGLLGKELKTPKPEPKYRWTNYGSSNPAGLKQPGDIAADSKNSIYVLSNASQEVRKYSNSGQPLGVVGSAGEGDGKFVSAGTITVDNKDNLYVGDQRTGNIHKFDPTGKFLLRFGSNGTADDQFRALGGISADERGFVYATDIDGSRIFKFDTSGKLIAKFASLLTNPLGIAADKKGFLYLRNAGQVKKLDINGRSVLDVGGVGTGNGQFEAVSGLGTDKTGNLYVADAVRGDIQKFDPAGKYLLKFGSKGEADGQYLLPGNIAVDAVGNMFVPDFELNSYSKFTP